jgi:hypothetical protein
MATALIIEEDCGTYTKTPYHPHNGYYAGDFGSRLAQGTALAGLTVNPSLRRTGSTAADRMPPHPSGLASSRSQILRPS